MNKVILENLIFKRGTNDFFFFLFSKEKIGRTDDSVFFVFFF